MVLLNDILDNKKLCYDVRKILFPYGIPYGNASERRKEWMDGAERSERASGAEKRF